MAKGGRKRVGGRSGARKRMPTKVANYRHESATRKNNPPAKIAAEGTVPAIAKAKYHYNPHRKPVLRFDPDGKPDKLPELLEEAKRRPLTDDETRLLSEALRDQQPLWDRAIFLVLLRPGLRVSELLPLDLEQYQDKHFVNDMFSPPLS